MARTKKPGASPSAKTGRKRKPKTLSQQGLLGQKGVNLIERIVLEMSSRWTPSGPNEVGIDGYIELFDRASGSALGKTLAVQSKAVSQFSNETNESFDYQCNARDLDYWLQGNMPVILVVSRPNTDEAYWMSIKDYFSGPEPRATQKIIFSKTTHKFTPESFPDLLELGRFRYSGLYLAPVPRAERLHSNLLHLKDFPSRIWTASTPFRKAKEIWDCFRDSEQNVDGAWILKEKKIFAFHDINDSPWKDVCEPGTVEDFESFDWSDSDNPDRQRQFVQLLNLTLRSQLSPKVRYWPREDCYAYVGYLDAGTKKLKYQSLKRRSSISVVTKYDKKTEDGHTFDWLRHLAFRGKFRRFEEKWYLEITPTYRFTWDGLSLYHFHENALKGIKRLEGNRAVLSSVLFWADCLKPKDGLFANNNRLLVFGELLGFELEVGINDKQWRKQDPDAPPDDPSDVEYPFLPGFREEDDS